MSQLPFNDKDKLYFVESLFDYTIPKQKAMDITSGGEPIKNQELQVVIATKESANKLSTAIEKLSAWH